MTNAPERPIEPSDMERSEWPDTTRQYVEWLEAYEELAQAAEAENVRLQEEEAHLLSLLHKRAAEDIRLRAENTRQKDVIEILALKIQDLSEVIGKTEAWEDAGEN